MQHVPVNEARNPVNLAAVFAAGGENANANANADRFHNSNGNGVTTERKRYLKERVEKKEEQVLKIEANVFQVMNYYFVFQGVILTGIINGSSSSYMKCRHVWIPLSLTLIGGLVNLGALFIIAEKYKDSLDELDRRNEALYWNLNPGQTDVVMSNYHRKKERRKWILRLSFLLFLIFAAINLAAATLILCT